ncbi:MAG TPA: ABC transporter permease [Ohtaekwangia sp.]|nr:ABC transporter permease [Ohtaekwangia sp.]
MFKNYFKTALRNLLREKSSTVINIAGLTLGITCSLILFLMISYMSSFDTFHQNRDRIYRVVNQSDGNQGTDYQSGVPSVLPDAFRVDFPEAEAVVFMSYRSGSLVTIPQREGESKKYQEERGVVYTEPQFFKIFDRAILQGNAANGLDEPNEAIIAARWAQKYFGRTDAVGEVLRFEDQEFKITAIMEDAPSNTDFPFDLMLSYSTVKKQREEQGWNSIWSDEQCYFLLKEGEDISRVESRMPAFTKKHLGNDDPDNTRFMFQALAGMHFDERFDTFSYSTVPKAMLIAFGVIALVLIVTACINFINLATAEAIKRSKEVGVRKSLGSTRGQLITQFLGETTFVTLLSVFLSLALTQLALSVVNPFMELDLRLDFTMGSPLWIYFLTVTVGVSVLAGLYPAFVVSGFRPAMALKSQMGNRQSSGYFMRRVLVVMQFWISQMLIMITIVIIHQMNYFQEKDLGFQKQGIFIAPVVSEEAAGVEGNHGSKMRTLRNQMATVPGVALASLGSAPPSSGNVSGTGFVIVGEGKTYTTQVKQIDGNYLDLYGISLIAGRNVLDLDTASGFLVNETLAKTAGFEKPEEMIGTVIRVWRKELPVVGVVKDFHTVSLHDPIEATVLFNRISGFQTLALKVDVGQAQSVLSALENKWEAAYPEQLFEYEFLDESIREFYEGEKKMSILLGVFTGMAIFIGCLGLFGLASFMANQKTKEIGVRKVLGASVESIVIMFSKEYVKLIVIGFIFAAPVAWLAMDAFLGEFAYKIELGPGIFITGLGVTLFLAVLTVSYKSLRAAVVNPVKSLRYE